MVSCGLFALALFGDATDVLAHVAWRSWGNNSTWIDIPGDKPPDKKIEEAEDGKWRTR